MMFGDKGEVPREHERGCRTKGCGTPPSPIAFSRSFLDKDRCRTFSEVIVTEGAQQYVIGTRLSVDNEKITDIDSLVSQ